MCVSRDRLYIHDYSSHKGSYSCGDEYPGVLYSVNTNLHDFAGTAPEWADSSQSPSCVISILAAIVQPSLPPFLPCAPPRPCCVQPRALPTCRPPTDSAHFSRLLESVYVFHKCACMPTRSWRGGVRDTRDHGAVG